MDFKVELSKKIEEFLNRLKDFIPQKDGYNDILIEAMTYSLFAGGKRIRPIIMEETYKLFGGEGKEIYSFMAAIEMIHTYSLIHDDLPAMDNDDFRRGLPTCHIKFGEDIAILTGDALLNRAFEIMIEAATNNNSMEILKAMKTISLASGSRGMIIGQIADVLNDNKPMDLELLNYINLYKTSALIEASFVAGAELAGASMEDVEIIRSIGRDIGLAFQIQDDILDVQGDEVKIGKPLNSDAKNNKTTYVTLLGVEDSWQIADKKLKNALDNIKKFSVDGNSFIISFIEYIKKRKH